MTIISLSLFNFEKEINNPKKTPKEILIDNHAGTLKKDNFKKSNRVPPFSKINLIYLNDWLTQTIPIITRIEINVFNKDRLKMYLYIFIFLK